MSPSTKKAATKRATRKPKPASSSGAKGTDFQATFAALVEILKPYERERGLVPGETGRLGYVLNSTKIGANKQPYMFAAVRIGKGYVSYYFMPIYMNPKRQATISPQLKARMQGKACFNFKQPDRALFEELAALTRAGHADFKKAGYL